MSFLGPVILFREDTNFTIIGGISIHQPWERSITTEEGEMRKTSRLIEARVLYARDQLHAQTIKYKVALIWMFVILYCLKRIFYI